MPADQEDRATAPTPVRASSVSRQLNTCWRGPFECPDLLYPAVQQMGDAVLIEGNWLSLGFAADALASLERYVITVGGQWLEDTEGFTDWHGWLEVRRG